MLAVAALRSAIVADARYSIDHEVSVHYAKATEPDVRPIPLASWKRHALPIRLDCSGLVTALYYRAGAPDPNGRGYDGYGNTETLLSHGTRIHSTAAQLADYVIFVQADGTSTHTALIIETGADPLLCSHGMEAGPIAIRLSSEKRYHPGETVVFVRSLPVVPQLRWQVRNGAGHTLATTKHPALYAIQHPTMFRTYQQISFHKETT